MTLLAGALAVLAALLFAIASVAQRGAAADVPDEEARGGRLIVRLVRSPRWWAGTIGDTGGFVVQAAALGVGALLLVQPLLVTTVLFALPLEARLTGRRIGRPEIRWAVVLVAALALFVVIGEPTAGVDQAPLDGWLPSLATLLVLLAVCVLAAGRKRGPRRAALLAVATGLAYGLVAALTKSVVDLLGDGPLALITSWETWVLIAAVLGGTLLQQTAFGAGPLAASLPAVTVGEPIVAAVLGVVVLGEQVRADGLEWGLIGLLVVLMIVATAALSRSSAAALPEPETVGAPT
ncbi:DMT family transporter [Actinomycetospora chibensis]|uniref:DMT family transporter n=1 Tax=Actinomycetospora chibensis TaxID=663606 RepID=A0ABV9RH94_9PSEU|nr:DMT family transporter [Actinomycetospora chibensis]MDD7922498.1 DMT family transporter [Actinomycetospora chibensis]